MATVINAKWKCSAKLRIIRLRRIQAVFAFSFSFFFSISVILLSPTAFLRINVNGRASMHRVQLTETGTMRFSIAQIISQVAGNR